MWNRFCERVKGVNYKVVTIKPEEFENLTSMYLTSPEIQASLATRTRHLIGRGLSVKIGGATLGEEEKKEFDEEGKRISEGYELKSATHGLGFLGQSPTTRKALWLNPALLSISFAVNAMDKRVYYIIPKSDASGSGQVGVPQPVGISAGTMLADVVPPGQRPSSGSQPTLSQFTDDELYNDFEVNELGKVVVFEEFAPDLMGKLTPPIRSLETMESTLNLLTRQWMDANERMANPTLHIVATEMSPLQRQQQMSFQSPGDTTRMANTAITANALSATQSHQLMESAIAQMNQRTQEEARQRSEQGIQHNTPDGRPERKNPESSFYTRKDWLDAGTTGFIGPRAQAPNGVIDYTQLYKSAVGTVTGVPASMCGDVVTAVAVNQNVQHVLNTTVHYRRGICELVIRDYYKHFFGNVIAMHTLEKFKKTPNKTTESLRRLVKESEVSVSFPALIDPLLIAELRANDAIDEGRYCQLQSAVNGLDIDMFSPEKMKVVYDLKIKNMELDVKIKEMQIKTAGAAIEATKAATAATAATPPKGAGIGGTKKPVAAASASTSSTASKSIVQPKRDIRSGSPGKDTSASSSTKRKLTSDDAKRGGGASKTGVAAGRLNTNTPRAQKAQ